MTSEEKRIKFHNKLKEVLGNNNVYYNPPSTTKLQYPCIIYNLSDIRTNKANNNVYLLDHVYQVTLIGTKVTDDTKDKILTKIPYSNFNRSYINNGLYHYVYTIFEK